LSFAEKFLEIPELFPARRSGEGFGSREIAIRFGGSTYLFRGLDDGQHAAIAARFSGLVCEGAGDDPVDLLVFRVAETDFLTFDLRGWEYRLDFEHDERSVSIAGLHQMARLEWGPRLRGALWTFADAAHPGFLAVFENFFRVVAAYELLGRGGVLLHSGAVVDRGRAHLFFGHSGAGKSTITKLSVEAGKEPLSDDLNAVVPDGDSVAVEKLPFAGDLGTAPSREGSVPAAGLFRIRQAAAPSIRRLSPGEALAPLFACAPYVNADPYREEQLAKALAGLVRKVGCWELHFDKSPAFWNILTDLK
jgi:hypothetical protein